jgi:hypothetical protein
MTRFVPSRHYLYAGLTAVAGAAFSTWCGLSWPLAFIPAVVFLASAVALVLLALRPVIEVHETHLVIGKEPIPWADIRRVDHAGWLSPLVVHLTLFDDRRLVVLYPGDPDAARRLLRYLRRLPRFALIDGVPHRRFWGDPPPPGGDDRGSPRCPLLRAEDEAEVERLYQRLKAVGHLDQKSSADEE